MTVSKEQAEELLDKLGDLYEDLLEHGIDQNVIEIPRTTNLDDREPVCKIEFTDRGCHWDIDVSCIDDSFTIDEVYGFMLRAESFMHQTLRTIESSKTIH